MAYIFKHPGRQPFEYLVTYVIYLFIDNNFIFHFPLLILLSTYSVECLIVTQMCPLWHVYEVKFKWDLTIIVQ